MDGGSSLKERFHRLIISKRMYARKLKSMKEMIGGGKRKLSRNKNDFRVRKVGKSTKKCEEKIPSLTLIPEALPNTLPHEK